MEGTASEMSEGSESTLVREREREALNLGTPQPLSSVLPSLQTSGYDSEQTAVPEPAASPLGAQHEVRGTSATQPEVAHGSEGGGKDKSDDWVEVQRRKPSRGEGKQASKPPPVQAPPPQQVDTEELDFEFDDEQLGGKKHNFSDTPW